MRVTYLLLSPTFGMHQYTADLANRMAEPFEVSVVTVSGCPADRYGPRVTLDKSVDLSNTGLSAESMRIRQLRQVRRAVQAMRPDVVHITGPHLWNLYMVRWLSQQGVPVIHTIHDLDPHHGTSYGRLLHLWNWAIIRWADHILVHGEVYKQRLISGGRRPEQVTCTPLTHLFVDHEMACKLSNDMPDVSYESMVLFFGRQERYKGVDTLIEAYERVRLRLAALRPDLQLVLAGPGDEYREKFDDGRPDVEWRNHLIGDEEGVALFRRCGVVVLPYRDATQSALVAAAYCFGKPVIVTAAGALAEYVDQDKTGLVVEGEPVDEALAEALLRVLGDPGYGATLGRAGRAWYDEKRAWETRCLVGMYLGLVD